MPDYTEIAAKVLTGLAKAGVAMTLRRKTRGTYSAASGAFTGDTTADYTVTGLIQPQRMWASGLVGENYFNGILVKTDDQFVLLAASGLGIVPTAGDLLVIGGTTYTVATIIPVRPGGVDLMYRILARK